MQNLLFSLFLFYITRPYKNCTVNCSLSIRGESQQKISNDIAKALNSSKAAAGRLVHTESAAFSSISRNDSYKALGLEEFEFIVALDESTCEQCSGMDGMHFPQEKYEIGVTAPPLHPWCRCATAPYFNDEFTQGEKRAARGEDGKTYYVSEDMTFEEWRNEHVNSADNIDIKGKFKDLAAAVTNKDINKKVDSFKENLKNVKNDDAKILLEQSLERTAISRSSKRNSYHSQGKVFLKDNVPESTIAHELFHEIDWTYGITQNGALQKSLENDWHRLNNIAFGYGKSVEDMILSKYKNAFIEARGQVKFKEEYRGISDILNGMSKGEIKLGYTHDDTYWSKTLALEKETWAQFGRILYSDDEIVLQMAESIFPNTSNEVLQILKGMIK